MDYCECCAKDASEVELLRSQVFTDRQTNKTANITICRECNDKARHLDRETWQKIAPFLK